MAVLKVTCNLWISQEWNFDDNIWEGENNKHSELFLFVLTKKCQKGGIY